MTVIAYKKGLIAGDTKVSQGGSNVGATRKIARNSKGDVAGVSGELSFGAAFLRWFNSGEKGKPPIQKVGNDPCLGDAFIVRRNGKIFTLEKDIFVEIEAPFLAIGSGAAEACGAMHAGAGAIAAVQAAIALDNGCGGDILAIPHRGPETRIKAGSW